MNADEIQYLGLSTTITSYDLYTYCENNNINYIDLFGHAPSLSTLTKMHNAVCKSAQLFLLSVGVITSLEVYTCNSKGKYNGRMDIYSYSSNRVWEVKRNNYSGIRGGKSQLSRYTTNYVYSLYHSLFSRKVKPNYGNKYVFGAIVVSDYLVFYHSYTGLNALIVYDYQTVNVAAKILYNSLVKSTKALLEKCKTQSATVRRAINDAITWAKNLAKKVGNAAKQVIDAIADAIKKAVPLILAFIAIVLFFCGVLADA